MKLIRLTRVLGNGMHPTSVVVINPMHVVAMNPRREVDGYGQPQSGTAMTMVVGVAFEVTEPIDVVMRLMTEET